jgi:hypothetical protein
MNTTRQDHCNSPILPSRRHLLKSGMALAAASVFPLAVAQANAGKAPVGDNAYTLEDRRRLGSLEV